MDRTELVKDILSEELRYWNKLRAAEKNPEERIKLHGACCEILMYAGFPERITTEYLREQYRTKIARTKNPAIKSRELDLIARNRAVKVCAAIARLGNRIKSIDKKAKDGHHDIPNQKPTNTTNKE